MIDFEDYETETMDYARHGRSHTSQPTSLLYYFVCKPTPFSYHSLYRKDRGVNQAEKRAEIQANQCHYGDKKQKAKIKRDIIPSLLNKCAFDISCPAD